MTRSAVGLIAISFLLIAGCQGRNSGIPNERTGPATPAQSKATVRIARELRSRTFEAIWSILADNLVYGRALGDKWEKLKQAHQAAVTGASDQAAFDAAIRGMLADLPADSARWQSRAERMAQESVDPGVYEGIGAYIAFRQKPQPHVILLEVVPGSPAQTAGLRRHDSLLLIDGGAVRADEAETVAARIRGPAGSTVSLRVRSPRAGARDVAVTRGKVDLSAVKPGLEYDVIPGTSIGYIRFPRGPMEELADKVGGALDALVVKQLTGLLLDLRIATIDGAWPVDSLLGFFTDGEVGESYTAGGVTPLSVSRTDRKGSQAVPLAVLAGPDTEGLPEIFVAILKEKRKAVIVGSATPGSVEGARPYALPDGSRIFVAVSSFRTTAGRDIGIEGVKPDVQVNADWDEVSESSDPVREAAVAALRGRR